MSCRLREQHLPARSDARPGRRLRLTVGLTGVAAVALVLLVLMPADHPGREPESVADAVPPGSEPVVLPPGVRDTRVRPEPPPVVDTRDDDEQGGFSVAVGPMVHESADAFLAGAADSIHWEVLERLRRVPELELIEVDASAIPNGPDCQSVYRRANGPGSGLATVIASGCRAPAIPDLPYDYSLAFSSRELPNPRSSGTADWAIGMFVTRYEGDRSSSSDRTILLGNSRAEVDAAGEALAIVDELRQRVFPFDAALVDEVRARVLDRTAAPELRLQALLQLPSHDVRGRGGTVTDEVVAAAIELANQSTPEFRAQVWEALRGVDNRRLIGPLTDAVLYDADDVARAAAMTVLEQFADDPTVRAALESVAGMSRDSGLGLNAAWTLLDDADRGEWVAGRLLDTQRDVADRLAPLRLVVERGTGASYQQYMEPVVEAGGVPVLGALLDDSDDIALKTGLIRSLERVRHPDVTEFLISVLANAPEEELRISVLDPLAGRTSEPGVIAALEAAATGDASELVRSRLAIERGFLVRLPPPGR